MSSRGVSDLVERVRGAGAGALSMGVSAAAVALALGVSLLVVAASGADPGESIGALIDGAMGSQAATTASLAKAVPLGLAALGWIVAWQARRLNIGLEGQMLLGGAASAFIGTQLSELPTFVHLPLAVAAGAVGGALWAGIAAVLWVKRGVNEIFSTLMLNLVALQVVEWLIRGPLAEGASASFARTAAMSESARWGRVVGSYVLSWDWVVLVGAVIVVGFVLPRTVAGYRLRLVGANPEAATFAGIKAQRTAALALVGSGALAGLAGSSLILAGETYRMTDGFAGGGGYLAIVVALVAANAPLGVLPAAVFFGALRQGGGLLEARAGVPSPIINVVTGLIIVFLAAAARPTQRLRTRAAARSRAPRTDPVVTIAAPDGGATSDDHPPARAPQPVGGTP